MSETVIPQLAEELAVPVARVRAAVSLLDEGATVPFIARYRKEATGGLDDGQLRTLADRLDYLRELEARRETILGQIRDQGRLTPTLEQAIRDAGTKQRLEDLFLPYRPKRRTRGQMAREAGLEPLARELREHPERDPEQAASAYVDAERNLPDIAAVLDGAKHLLAEHFAEDAALVGALRELAWERGLLVSEASPRATESGQKFADYFDYREPIRSIPSHRALALFRGRREGMLRLSLVTDEDEPGRSESRVAAHFGISHRDRAADDWLATVVRFTWRVKLLTRIETDLFTRLRERAEEEAIRVFTDNLRDLLLAPPAGGRCVMGIDPGVRTGCKVAVVDATGRLLDTDTVHPLPPRRAWSESLARLEAMARRHGVELVAVGNGTGSRETERLVRELRQRAPDLGLSDVMVSEAGASVYSASEAAATEFPELDVTLRGAVSIARRLQDPLAELVKIDPRAIGVGQYQHDVAQNRLARSLDAVVEDCVNAVGVDLNTASPALLARVSGLSTGLAEQVVAYRDANGPFPDRQTLRQVSRLGEKTFQQAAGFLRIANGRQPLDASAVHPEAYPVVERLLVRNNRRLETVIGDRAFLQSLNAADYTDDRFGEPTVRDILRELEKPGRDPRPEFQSASFRDGVEKPADLEPGMILEGVVTNVTNFGAFVDVGVHQDGLVHISAMSERFVSNPRDVVRSGQVVKVKVLSVDLARNRIALTLRLQDPLPDEQPDMAEHRPRRQGKPRQQPPGKNKRPDKQAAATGSLGDALLRARHNGKTSRR